MREGEEKQEEGRGGKKKLCREKDKRHTLLKTILPNKKREEGREREGREEKGGKRKERGGEKERGREVEKGGGRNSHTHKHTHSHSFPNTRTQTHMCVYIYIRHLLRASMHLHPQHHEHAQVIGVPASLLCCRHRPWRYATAPSQTALPTQCPT